MAAANKKNTFFVRDLEAGDLLEDFLVTSVFSILVVRFFLHITGYPQIGGAHFHIAHMLYGGLIMMSAIVILVLFLNREAKQIGSIVGGVGFGLFIDELGKFVTRNNNYFFEPTIALIYVIFIVLFLLIRASDHFIKVDEEGYAMNAIEVMKELVTLDLDAEEKRIALSYLRRSDKENPMVQAMTTVLESTRAVPRGKPRFLRVLRNDAARVYRYTIHSKYFSTGVIVIFVLQSLWHVVISLYHFHSIVSFFDVGSFVSSVLSGVLVAFGIFYLLRHERLRAYIMFKYAVLLSIFLTQFFLFYQEQLSAISQLFWNLVIYIVLRVVIIQELRLEKEPETLLTKIKNIFT